MLKQIWRQIVGWFRRLLGIGNPANASSRQRGSQKSFSESGEKEVTAPPELTDSDLESLFMQLLEGVHQGRGQAWALKWLKNIENRIPTQRWVDWLQRFGQRLLASPAPNNELAARLVQFGEVGGGEVGEVAYEVGMQLLTRNPAEPIWEYDGPDAAPVASSFQEGMESSQEAELETMTLDELFVRLQQDDNLRSSIAQQLGLETTDPEVIMQELIKQFQASEQSTQDNT